MSARFAPFALALALAAAFCAPPAWSRDSALPPPASLAESETSCLAVVDATLEDADTVADTVTALRKLTRNVSRGPCKGPDTTNSTATDLVAQVGAAIAARRAAYDCAAVQSAACEGLGLAGLRLEAVQASTLKPGLASPYLHRANALLWDADHLSFGTDHAAGASFLKLVLRAGPARGSPLETGVAADSRYPTLQPALQAPPLGQAVCDAACKLDTGRVIALYPLFSMLEVAYQSPAPFVQTEAQITLRRDRWQAYHFGGGGQRAQLPWELLANSVVYEQTHAAPADDRTWPEPPNGALILLHPSVGMTLKDTTGADSNIVGVVELLGYSTWGYDDQSGARKNEWGASVIAAYHPRTDAADWGFGALVRLPWQGVNLAWTRTRLHAGGSDDALLISIDISKIFARGDGACLFNLPSCGTVK